MEDYWQALMAYAAPPEELHAWRTFFINSSYAQKPAAQAISAMTFALLYNPYFLLKP